MMGVILGDGDVGEEVWEGIRGRNVEKEGRMTFGVWWWRDGRQAGGGWLVVWVVCVYGGGGGGLYVVGERQYGVWRGGGRARVVVVEVGGVRYCMYCMYSTVEVEF